jgi:sigma-B regulation protein RsbU (phosphoserine phosphatase)
MKILIAEDDPVSRLIIETTLQIEGHEVLAAAGGAEAWAAFDANPVRVIVSDWMMPEFDGLDLCRRVRTRPETAYTYFILLTAIHPGRENFLAAMNAGVDDFLSKPLDRDTILMRLRVADRILGYTNQIRQLEALLPICMYCKKIRDEHDSWQDMETYICAHTGSDFSHGMCPDCFEREMRALR